MANPSVVEGDLYVSGRLIAAQYTPPAGSVGNAAILGVPGAYLEAGKSVHRFGLPYAQVPGTAILAATQDLRIIRGATGVIASFEAAITGAVATGADRTVTVDLQKSTGAGAFATVLSSVITFTNVSVLRVVSTATILTANVVDNDILRVVVAVAGSASAQAQGLVVSVTLQEDPL